MSRGRRCPPLLEWRVCYAGECGLDCVLSEWSPWTPCSAKCGWGLQRRARDVRVYPRGEGKKCDPVLEERECSLGDCATNCRVSEWSRWGRCLHGLKTRTRTIVSAPNDGGLACPELAETRKCEGDDSDERRGRRRRAAERRRRRRRGQRGSRRRGGLARHISRQIRNRRNRRGATRGGGRRGRRGSLRDRIRRRLRSRRDRRSRRSRRRGSRRRGSRRMRRSRRSRRNRSRHAANPFRIANKRSRRNRRGSRRSHRNRRNRRNRRGRRGGRRRSLRGRRRSNNPYRREADGERKCQWRLSDGGNGFCCPYRKQRRCVSRCSWCDRKNNMNAAVAKADHIAAVRIKTAGRKVSVKGGVSRVWSAAQFDLVKSIHHTHDCDVTHMDVVESLAGSASCRRSRLRRNRVYVLSGQCKNGVFFIDPCGVRIVQRRRRRGSRGNRGKQNRSVAAIANLAGLPAIVPRPWMEK